MNLSSSSRSWLRGIGGSFAFDLDLGRPKYVLLCAVSWLGWSRGGRLPSEAELRIGCIDVEDSERAKWLPVDPRIYQLFGGWKTVARGARGG